MSSRSPGADATGSDLAGDGDVAAGSPVVTATGPTVLTAPPAQAGDRSAPGASRGGTTAPVRDDVARSTLQAVKWNFAATMASLVGRLVFTFVLARILGPENFGVVAVAMIYVAFVSVVLDQGFGAALVQKKDLSERDVGTVAWLNVVSGLSLAALTLVAAPFVERFFSTPHLASVLRVLSLTLVLRGFVLVPNALLQRGMRFREQAQAQTVAMLAGGAVGIAAGLAGADYWSLVVQTLVNDVILTVWLVTVAGTTSWRPSWSSLRSMLTFSVHVMLSAFLMFFGSNSDNLLVARVEGATQVAFYALAYRLLRLPIQTSASVVNTVALPVLSRLQDDDERSRSWFLVATQSLALLTFPAFALLAVGAQDGVRAFFGEQWSGAVAPMQVLALAGIPMVMRMLLSPLATSRARTTIVLRWTVIPVGLQVVGFAIGVKVAGIVGVAMALLVVQWLTWVPHVRSTLTTLLGVEVRSYLRALVPAAVVSVDAACVWYLAEVAQRHLYGGPLGLQVLVSAVLAGAAYLGLLRLVWPEVYGSTAGLLREMARRRSGAAAAGDGAPAAAAAAAAAPASRGTIIARPAFPSTGNSMNAELSRALQAQGWQVVEFTWWRVLRGRFDVWLESWPETLVQQHTRGAFGRVKQTLRWVLVLVVVRRVRGRRPVVQLVHNVEPHEPLGRAEAWVLRRWQATQCGLVHLSPATYETRVDGLEHLRLRHGTYPVSSDRAARATPARSGRVVLLSAGHIRRYKDLPRLADVVLALPRAAGVALRVAGSPTDSAEVAQLQERARRSDRVSLRLGWLSDDELDRELQAAAAVVLAHQQLTNSGAALLALGSHVPVIGPAVPVLLELKAEVGHPWVHLYDGVLDEAVLADAVERLQASAPLRAQAPPDLSCYTWERQARDLSEWLTALTSGAWRARA